jgi:hypothetical protein
VIGVIAGLIMTAAVAQALLYGGNNPRRASQIAGVVYCLVAPLMFYVASIAMQSRGWGPAPSPTELICTLIGLAIFGNFFGYVAGVLAAGAFLATDYLRQFLDGATGDDARDYRPLEAHSPWDDDEI